jgi:hypothetical protein
MDGKITLITPPDIFENESLSILFMHLSDEDQDNVSNWLKQNLNNIHINIYFYSGETNMNWLFHALSRCEYKFIDIDKCNKNTERLLGYILGKQNVFYKVTDVDSALIYNHINQNKITNVEIFLEKAFNDKK